jgi:hypothetical protein
MRTALAVIWAGLLLGGCGGGSSTRWIALRSVRITVAQPGLPPLYGRPRTSSFTTPGELAHVTAALNAHHIAKALSSSSIPGCGGGYQITITIVPEHSSPVQLSAYRCANQASGDVSGDLVGFLSSVGVSL